MYVSSKTIKQVSFILSGIFMGCMGIKLAAYGASIFPTISMGQAWTLATLAAFFFVFGTFGAVYGMHYKEG